MWRFGLAKKLQKIVGKDAVLEGSGLLHRYSISMDNRPRFVCLPKSAQEISQIVEVARASKVRIAVVNPSSPVPVSYPKDTILLDLAAMSNILDIDAANLSATVEPLASLSALRGKLEPLGLSVCSSRKDAAMATDLGSEAFTGVELVLPNGCIANIGGKPREFLGYSLLSLFAAAGFALGIPTKVSLRLERTNQLRPKIPLASTSASTAETEMLARLSDILDPSKTFARSSATSAGKLI